MKGQDPLARVKSLLNKGRINPDQNYNLKRSTYRTLFFGCTVLLVLSFSLKDTPKTMGEYCRILVQENIDCILKELTSSNALLKHKGNNRKYIGHLRKKYEAARKSFKRIEFFMEYYSPLECKLYINGPLVPKVDKEISAEAIDPHGFQVLEENLYNENKTDVHVLLKEYALLQERLLFFKDYYATIRIEENKLMDAIKLHIVRVMCLTLNGYDCTINKQAITETFYSLDGIRTLLTAAEKSLDQPDLKAEAHLLVNLITSAQRQLKKHPDSDSFNRLQCITDQLYPIYKKLFEYTSRFNRGSSGLTYAVNIQDPNFFASNGINKQYFSVYKTDTLGNKFEAELGKLLFYDPILSGNNMRACASCHKADKAFTDGTDRSITFDRMSHLTRNSPTLLNAAYQKLYFHDGRVFNLEGQADEVFNNTFEMQSGPDEIISKLKQSPEYKQLFMQAFKGKADSAITFYAVIKCIAEFIKELDSRNSRFDKYLNGNKKALSKQEINGFNLFSGKALCGSCHFFPLFNGTVPPFYNDNEFEVLGVPQTETGRTIDPDTGRENISKSPTQRFAFKTPTLRNIALTAPYMHNGAFKSLDSVLVFYNRGGGVGLGMKLPNQTLPFDSLGLSRDEIIDIKQFLLTLTDTSSIPKVPKQLPRFNNASLNARTIGGDY